MATTNATRSTPATNGKLENGDGVEQRAPTLAPRSLMRKLLEVASAIPDIEKDGHNDFADYDFATAENILRKVREPLSEKGILLLASLDDVVERPIKTAKGKDSAITTVRVTFTLIDSKTGQMFASSWAGTGDDPSDKGLYKAYTGAVKTFLRVTFLLPLGDDPEADSRADERTEGAPEGPPPDRKLPAEKIEPLRMAVASAGLADVLPMKLRGFGVTDLADLTVEQAIGVYEWAKSEATEGEAQDG